MNENDNWEDLIDRHLRGEVDDAKKERLAELLDSLMIQHHQVVPNIAGVPAGHHPLSHHGHDPAKIAQLKVRESGILSTSSDLLS